MSVAKSRRKHGALAAEAVASASSRTRTPRARENRKPRRNIPQRMRRLWRESLQFRALATAGVLMFLSFLAVGWSLSSQIATSLFENQKSQALQESISGFRNVQSVLNSSEMRSDSEIRRNVSRTLTVLDAGASGKRSWILVPLEGQGKQGFIPEQSSDKSLNSSSIPTDFKNTVRDRGGVYWQTSTITTFENNRERTYPVLIVGTHVSIAQNPNYGLFTVYDMTDSSATIAHINFVLFGGFCALLTVVLSVVWFVTRFVVRPITQTAITAERLAAGDLDQRVSVKGEDQAARLGISFNRMADSLQEKIVQLERLSTLQQRFVSDVSHELRTPLSTVRLGTELLYDSRENMTPMQVRSVELLHGQVDRFQSMLADLLEISRFDAGSAMLTIDTEDFIQVLSNILQEALPHLERTNTKLNVHTNHESIMVDMDRVRIERVLRNLLYNAIEHGESRPIDVYVDANATNLGIAVRDHGIGLSEDEAVQVFNRFWRADTSRKRTLGGTGLGLSIAAEDVRLHGGTLEAWGEKGRGACFTMNLPLVHGAPLGESPVLATGEPEASTNRPAIAQDTLPSIDPRQKKDTAEGEEG
ncbi:MULTISPECIES: MtrAB system histidine kinase MtrB [Rothia]|uniref:MtrAB system histidine kinase MtrB n=1 Tax=Rothia TaxID=32207 RepID=UPI001CAC011E|nr:MULTISPECIES: MtrAB system histidine kinase MtrB [Rothia]MBF1676263.1 HAMP domain-containing histidine kinase [Rothia sp. (in: high G+C Gram-positive bacteria)]